MPAFRNLKTRRSSGRNSHDNEEYWERSPRQMTPYPREVVLRAYSRSSSATPSSDEAIPSRHTCEKPKSRKRHNPDHIPRPRNAFIFFRSEYYKNAGGIDQNKISIEAGKKWKEMTLSQRQPFIEMARKEKEEHRTKYPNYTYTPAVKATPKRRKLSIKKKALPVPTRVVRFAPQSPAPRSPYSCSDGASITPSVPSTPSIAAKSEPFLNLVLDFSDSKPVFTPNWSFVPTSEIPPLELPPLSPKTIKAEELELLYLLQPSNLDYVDDVFEPKPEPSLFLITELNYNYGDDFPYVLGSHLPSELEVRSDQLYASLTSDLTSELDTLVYPYPEPEDASNSFNFDDVFAKIEDQQLSLLAPPSLGRGPVTSDGDVDEFMNQYIDFEPQLLYPAF